MSIALDSFCFAVPFTMLFAAVLSVADSVGGCGCPISARTVITDVSFWNFSNNPPNYDSMADAIIFFIMLYYTLTGTFYGGIDCNGVLHFGPRKIIHLLCFVPMVLICSMYRIICGESFHFSVFCYCV